MTPARGYAEAAGGVHRGAERSTPLSGYVKVRQGCTKRPGALASGYTCGDHTDW